MAKRKKRAPRRTPGAKAPAQAQGGLSVTGNAGPRAAARVTAVATARGRVGSEGGTNAMAADALERVAHAEAVAAPRARWTAPTARLPDVGEATFGKPGPAPESVIGTDERRQVTDTQAYPWRALASLLIVARDNSRWVGTGWFISPRTLVTAGHCVFIHNPEQPHLHGWVKSISVMPGRNAASLPFDAVTSTDFKSVDGWTVDGRTDLDYGAIIIPTPLGDRVGTIGFGKFTDDQLRAMEVHVAGYPSDKDVGTLWHDRRGVANVDATKVFYDHDTAGGQSGAPVWHVNSAGDTVAVAVHAYGTGGNVQSNSGTRITDGVYAALRSWMV